MKDTDVQFLEDNAINFQSIELGFTREISHENLNTYEMIYQENLDKSFFLNSWCGSCVFDMLKRLKAHYEGIKYVQSINQKNEQIKNPRGRRKV